MARVGGIVLCGGQSTRMGQPKEWLPWGDVPLLVHVVQQLQQVLNPLLVVADPTREVPPLPNGVFLVRDAEQALGPLNGLARGLRALGEHVHFVYLSACDVPLVRPAFVARVVQEVHKADIVMPFIAGHAQPLAGLYRATVRPVAEQLLAGGQRRLLDLTRHHSIRYLNEAAFAEVDPELQSLRNMNTPEDYQAFKPASTV